VIRMQQDMHITS